MFGCSDDKKNDLERESVCVYGEKKKRGGGEGGL